MNTATAMVFYNLCDKDDDCERGRTHKGACGPKSPKCPHEGGCACDGPITYPHSSHHLRMVCIYGITHAQCKCLGDQQPKPIQLVPCEGHA